MYIHSIFKVGGECQFTSTSSYLKYITYMYHSIRTYMYVGIYVHIYSMTYRTSMKSNYFYRKYLVIVTYISKD